MLRVGWCERRWRTTGFMSVSTLWPPPDTGEGERGGEGGGEREEMVELR